MSSTFASVKARASLVSSAALLLAFACSVEERSLNYGSLGASGLSQAGRGPYDPVAAGGEAGAWPDGGQGGGAGEPPGPVEAGASSLGGSLANGGTGSTVAGSATGGAVAGAGAGGGSGAGGQAASGAAGSASAGSGGSDFNQGRCGDLDANGVQDCEETVVHNATFDKDTQQWLADPGVAADWRQLDALGTTGSGSLSVKFTTSGSTGEWATSAAGQCVQAWEGTELALGARTLVPDGQGAGSAQLNLAMFGNDACAGSFIGMTTPLFSPQTGAWQRVQGVVKLAPGTRSVLVRLALTKPGSQPSFEALFDNILLRSR